MRYVVLRAEEVKEVWPDVYMLITSSSLPCGDVSSSSFFTAFFFFLPSLSLDLLWSWWKKAGRAIKVV